MSIVGESSFDMQEIMWLVEPELSGVTTSKLDDFASVPHPALPTTASLVSISGAVATTVTHRRPLPSTSAGFQLFDC